MSRAAKKHIWFWAILSGLVVVSFGYLAVVFIMPMALLMFPFVEFLEIPPWIIIGVIGLTTVFLWVRWFRREYEMERGTTLHGAIFLTGLMTTTAISFYMLQGIDGR